MVAARQRRVQLKTTLERDDDHGERPAERLEIV
jgi:hypothetical protein